MVVVVMGVAIKKKLLQPPVKSQLGGREAKSSAKAEIFIPDSVVG